MRTLTRDGYPVAWISSSGSCSHPACRKARREGRPVHITPAPHDPRAENFTLALPEYHFATEDEAIAALDAAWDNAEIASNVEERDAAYARGVAVKIRKDIVV